MKESTLQSLCVKYLRGHGYKVIRLINASERGIPDILVIGINDLFFVEFKTKKGRLSKLQKYQIDDLKRRGVRTYVIRSLNDLINILSLSKQE
jgi:Holliday junction resolvase